MTTTRNIDQQKRQTDDLETANEECGHDRCSRVGDVVTCEDCGETFWYQNMDRDIPETTR
jgi:hypothetical protein